MKAIDAAVPLKGALKCSVLLSTYLNMPVTNEAEKDAANKTLNEAFECLNGEGIPFYEIGCDYKYQMDKDT